VVRGVRRVAAVAGDVSVVEDPASVTTGAGAEVDQRVGVPDDVEVVLDDDDGVPVLNGLIEHIEQRVAVAEVEAGRGFVEA
jgi:hypothetical protein